MAKRKKKQQLRGLKSVHALSAIKSARAHLKLARSNAAEGFCQHALNHLTEAARYAGEAHGHEFEAGGKTYGAQRDIRDTLRSVGRRVLACAIKK